MPVSDAASVKLCTGPA